MKNQNLHKYCSSRKSDERQILDLFIAITDKLNDLHKKNHSCHTITPETIFINTDTGKINISASLKTKGTEDYDDSSNKVNTKTIRYISPEQTGRVPIVPDYRSDYYSLGIIFYEILTGEPPFTDTEPSDLIHAHIARKPTPPYKKNCSLTRPISDITMKLIEKYPDNRYQSAAGLIHDLRFCIDQIEKPDCGDTFRAGSHDVSPLFRIPEKLYGRHKEIQILVNEFSKVEKGATRYFYITGPPGIGKSFFIHETRHIFTGKGAYFISGKFEQYTRDVPYHAFIQAFTGLICQLLTESDESLTEWKKKIKEAVGINGKIVTDIIPELVHIIGPQKKVEEMPPQEAQNRFNYVIRNLLQAFASREHPLVIFIDDMQWADRASVRLMELFHSASATSSIFIITAYRNAEIQVNIPAAALVQAIQSDHEKAHLVILEPVNSEYISALLEDTFYSEIDEDNDLMKTLLEKTNGNPLYIKELLLQLYRNGSIFFHEDSPGNSGWRYDIDRITRTQIPENLVDIITQRVRLLPEDIQDALKIASCIGVEFSVNLLAEMLSLPVTDVLRILDACIKENLVLIQNDTCQFMHDKVQESFNRLLAEEEITLLHYKIGMLLLGKFKDIDKYIFDIVNHLNLTIFLIDSDEEKTRLCKLNYRAGLIAKKSNAYDFAAELFKTGISLLDDNGWSEEYALMLSLHEEAAEAAYLSTDYDAMEKYTSIVLSKTNNILDQIKVYLLKMNACISLNQPIAGVRIGLDVLKRLGLKLPEKPSKINVSISFLLTKFVLLGKSDKDIQDLPRMTNPHILAMSQILAALSILAYQSNPVLLLIIAFKTIRLFIRFGNASVSPYIYAGYGFVNCIFGNIPAGYRFGKISINLVKTMIDVKAESYAKTHYVMNFLIRHWNEHVRETFNPFLFAYQKGLDFGDFEFAALNLESIYNYSYHAGVELTIINNEMKTCTDIIEKINQKTALFILKSYHEAVISLVEITDNPAEFKGKVYDENIILPALIESGSFSAIIIHYVLKVITYYLFYDYNKAIENSNKTMKNIDAIAGAFQSAVFHFYYSLSLLASCNENKSKETKKNIKIALKNQKKLKKWAHHAPMNHLHKYHLVEAEIARVKGNHVKAMDLYDKAIQGARDNLYINEEALANELAAKYYLSRKMNEKAGEYMTAAYRCYEQWGAIAKCRHLTVIYPELFVKDETVSDNEGNNGILKPISGAPDLISFSSLDLQAIQSAIMTISNEKELEQSIKKILRVICSSSGAQRAVLLFYLDNEIYLYGTIESITGTEGIYDIHYGTLGTISFPETVVRFVKRTGDTVVLENAIEDNRFCIDPYINKNIVKSTLCMPLLKIENREIIIYLENNYLTDVFNLKRMNVINTITSQLKTVIENLMLKEMLIKDKIPEKKEHKSIEDILQQDYGLTIQEVRITLMLKDGISRDEVCDELKISHKTLKNHLYSIYSKTINTNEDDFVITGRIDKLSKLILFLMEIEK